MTGTSSTRSTSAKRRRPFLLSFTALGVVIGLLGIAGVFATSSDRATTGQNDARSGDLVQPEPKVDLQLASATSTGTYGPVTCGTDWSDELTSGVLQSDGVALDGTGAGSSIDLGYVCIRNVGDTAANYSAKAIELVDTELTCAPGELAVDATCGGSGLGELSSHLPIWFDHINPRSPFTCANQTDPWKLSDLATNRSAEISYLAPGEVDKVCIHARWTPADNASQTDASTWRFAFDGTEHTCPADVGEPNDGYTTATPLAGPTELDAWSCRGDWDHYRVAATGLPGTVTISGFPGTNVPGHLRLLLLRQSDGVSVAVSLNGAPEQVTVPATGGPFLIEVQPLYAAGETSYHLSYEVALPPCADDAFEPNPNTDSAPLITTASFDAISCPEDNDFFRLDAAGPLQLQLSGHSASLDVAVFNAAGDYVIAGGVAQSTSTSGGTATLHIPAAGTYYLRVVPSSSNTTPYHVTISAA